MLLKYDLRYCCGYVLLIRENLDKAFFDELCLVPAFLGS